MDKTTWIADTCALGGESFTAFVIVVILLPVIIPMFLIGLMMRMFKIGR